MGGMSSGRQGGRDTTDSMRALDVRKLQREGLLVPGRAFSWLWSRRGAVVASINCKAATDSVTLEYRQRNPGGDWQDMSYPVRLTWTPCHYGGRRAWWLCPAVGCGRRVAVLYGGSVFACRHCHRLAYTSQRETPEFRAFRRADKLRDRLGWGAGIANPKGSKPKGMHWRTFERLEASHDAHAGSCVFKMPKRFEKLMRR